MATLLQRIEANAAERLRLPPGGVPSQELDRYRRFLKVEYHRLRIQHRAGGHGLEICRARSAVFDLLLRHLFETAAQNAPPPTGAPRLSLVAIGGYGRSELCPHSDIDIMFLHDGGPAAPGRAHPHLSSVIDGVLYPLWDLKLKVGHAVRSIADCVTVLNQDMKSKTSLIEARFIAGDAALCQRMQQVVLAKCVRGYEAEYIAARIADQAERRAKFGNSATMQEPNLKNGCGGLRDYQNLLWMTFFKYRAGSLNALLEHDLINEAESKQLLAAYDFLLRARNELHYETNQSADVLTKSLQASVAFNLGYTERPIVKRLEDFMRVVYTHMRNIYLITRTLEQRLALLPQPERRLPSLRAIFRRGRQRVRQELVDGFKFLDGEIHPLTNRVFRDQPRRLMRVFFYSQQRGLRLHPDLVQLIRQQLRLVDRTFLQDEHVRETFLEIISHRGAVAPTLRAMHEAGFLGKYLPEFGKLTCLVQHEFYHRYTTDEHTLVCLEKLDQIWGTTEPHLKYYAEILQGVEHPSTLYLALLLHDAGKAANSGDHSKVGAQIAASVGKRIGLDQATTATFGWLIENHLTMSKLSQQRDLEDPGIIRNFAASVRTPENLAMLTLHTLADSLGTSDQLWNDFRDSLLRTLYQKTRQLLTGGAEFIQAEAQQHEALARDVRKIAPPTFTDEEVEAHWTNLPRRYFQIHSARAIANDLAMVHRFMHWQITDEDRALEPVITWHNERDRAYTVLGICTWDRSGLFSKIAGSLTAAGLNILSAQIFTREDGIIIDSFYVTDAHTGLQATREERERFESLLHSVLTGHLDLAELVSRRKASPSLYQPVSDERLPTTIHFDNSTPDSMTVIDVEAEDRLGLLYAISRALNELHLDIYLAKISTEKGGARDSFYVAERGAREGKKIERPQRQKEI